MGSKILYLVNNAYVSAKYLGGGDRYVMAVAKHLKKYKITVITPKIGLHHWQNPPVKGIKFQILQPSVFDNHANPLLIGFAYLVRVFNTLRLLKNLPKADILISASDLLPDTLPAYMFKRTEKVTWVVNIGHLVVQPFKREGNFIVNAGAYFLQQICLRLLRRADMIRADNQNLKEALAQSGIPRRRIQVHYGGGIDLKKAAGYKAKKERQYTAVFVGRLVAPKGVFDLVPIWSEVVKNYPQALLAIVGSGSQDALKKLRKEIKKFELERNIKLLGFLAQQKEKTKTLFDVLTNSKLFLFTDHEAGFGLAVVEAMAFGLPVVAYRLPIFGTTYRQGFVSVPQFDRQVFAREIIRIVKNPQLYQKLKKKALIQAQEFEWDKVMNQLQLSLDQLSAF